MKAAFETLGCKVNQYETRAMEQLLRARGHTVASPSEEADAYIVNTCSVTAAAGQKSRQAVRRLRRAHPGAVIAVCGCFVQTDPDAVRALGADVAAGSGDRTGFVALLEEAVDRRNRGGPSAPTLEAVDKAAMRRDFEVLPAARTAARTRALLKVEDGCANFCAYCIIPYARGPVRSAPAETAVRQARELAAAGVREIVVTGIEISSWGRDLDGRPALTDLLEAVCAAVPDVRVRLGSLEPRTVTEDFCRRAAALPNLCPQFHLSLQSGCDDTLRAMNRRYDTARYLESVNLLRRFFDRPALTTDLITGFPGETEEQFAQTLDFLRRCAFAKVHVFPYSPRPGTTAAKREQIPKAVREARARRAASVAAETRTAYLTGCVGARYAVLFEQPEADGPDRWRGRAPNYMEVLAEGRELRNEVRPVRILSADGDRLYGTIEEAP